MAHLDLGVHEMEYGMRSRSGNGESHDHDELGMRSRMRGLSFDNTSVNSSELPGTIGNNPPLSPMSLPRSVQEENSDMPGVSI